VTQAFDLGVYPDSFFDVAGEAAFLGVQLLAGVRAVRDPRVVLSRLSQDVSRQSPTVGSELAKNGHNMLDKRRSESVSS